MSVSRSCAVAAPPPAAHATTYLQPRKPSNGVPADAIPAGLGAIAGAYAAQQILLVADGLTQAEAETLNALLMNLAQTVGLQRAVLAALDRAQAAEAAGAPEWASRQKRAAQLYYTRLAALAAAQPRLLDAVGGLLKGSVTVDVADLVAYQAAALTSGALPPALAEALTQLGASSLTLADVRNGFALEGPESVTDLGAGSFPQALSDLAVAAKLQDAASSLSEGLTDVPLQTWLPMLQQ